MGKSRITITLIKNSETINDNTYTTSTGVKIDKENYDDEFFENLEANIDFWIKYGGSAPTFFMTKEELDYIKSHMENSDNNPTVPSGILTRVERARHFLKHDYKVGDVIEDEAEFRSYSREQEGTLKYIQRNGNEDRPIVIYRTNGNVKHFNASKFDNTYSWESESLVEQNKMRIIGIKELTGNNLKNLPKELGVNADIKSFGNHLPPSITIVDVEQVTKR